jgi:uncharacterized membrane protein
LSSAGVSLVNIPIFVQAASAEAKLSSLSCPTSTAAPAVTLSVQPSVGELALGQVDTTTLTNFTQPVSVQPAALVNLLLLQVNGQAQVNIGGADWQTVSFSQSDIAADTVKSVSTNDIAQATAASLLGNTTLSVQLGGFNLGLGSGPVKSAVQSVLTAAAPSLDTLINTLSNVLGVRLGTADVWVNGLRCNNAALVA